VVRTILFIFLLVGAINKIQSQSFSTKLAQALDTFDLNYPQEKIFLHSDRSSYIANESIWFKAYCTLDGTPSILSKIMYVELVNSRNEVVEKKMLHLVNGTAYGDIFLKKELPSGTYSLNGYTLWMLNFSEAAFKKPVYIFNTDTANDTKALLSTGQFDFTVKFFPEGGELVLGLNSKIAFKALTNYGLPLSVSGDITDSKNNIVGTLQTMHDGMGAFHLTPLPGERYNAVFATTDGKRKSVQLPAAKAAGIVLHVDNESGTKIFFQLQRSQNKSGLYNKILLVGRMNNTIVYTSDINFDEGLSAGAIPKKTLPSGIFQLTAFDEAGTPLAERLVFIDNFTLPEVEVKKDSFSTEARKKNLFTIKLSDYKNIRASVSVTNYSADSTDLNDNFLTSLLLTSDIKGSVNNPGYYFKDKSEEKTKHLDLLLLTQGWRKFNWDDIIAKKLPVIKYPIESFITVKGKITKLNGKQAVQQGRMDFITKTEDSLTILSTINLKGNDDFVLSGLDFKKTASIFYQGANAKKENALVKVMLYPSHIDTLKKGQNYFSGFDISLKEDIHFTSFYKQLLDERRAIEKAEGKLLSEVIVRAKKLSAADSLSNLYVSGNFMNSDHTIATGKYNLYDIWRFLQMQIAGISLGKNESGETTVFMREPISSNVRPEFDISDPTTNIDFYLNEIKVSKDLIESINPEDIVLVKVWKNVSAFTIGSEQSAIAFYTDKSKSSKAWGAKGFDVFKKEGYAVSREFYSLDYSTISPESSFVDFRPTLYWNPNLKPDKNGNALIKFFNDDAAKKFKLVIQGIDDEGKIISVQKILE